MERTVILLDGKNALFRFGYVHRHLKYNDKPTGAVYGILGCLLRLKKAYPAAYFVMVWEGGGQSWRHRVWEGYKANRKRGGDVPAEIQEIFSQEKDVQLIAGTMAIPQLQVYGLEADDVIGIVARHLAERGHKVIVYSSDQDFLQLMRYGVQLIRDVNKSIQLRTGKLQPETEASVRAKFCCSVENLLMVRAIAGDTSDAITGAVRGVGVKTAARYVTAGVYPDKVTAAWATVLRNKRLMRIVTQVSSKELDEPTRSNVIAAIELVESGLMHERLASYDRLIAELAARGLTQAMEARAELVHIQYS
jgi:DNA polymerase-1